MSDETRECIDMMYTARSLCRGLMTTAKEDLALAVDKSIADFYAESIHDRLVLVMISCIDTASTALEYLSGRTFEGDEAIVITMLVMDVNEAMDATVRAHTEYHDAMMERSPLATPGALTTCPECHREFDLTDAQDAGEWVYGHDCEAS